MYAVLMVYPMKRKTFFLTLSVKKKKKSKICVVLLFRVRKVYVERLCTPLIVDFIVDVNMIGGLQILIGPD